MSTPPRYAVVVPTVGRPSLIATLEALAAGDGPPPADVVVVDDRPGTAAPLRLETTTEGRAVRVLRSGGGGPAAARNTGWQAAEAEWACFSTTTWCQHPTGRRDWPKTSPTCPPTSRARRAG